MGRRVIVDDMQDPCPFSEGVFMPPRKQLIWFVQMKVGPGYSSNMGLIILGESRFMIRSVNA